MRKTLVSLFLILFFLCVSANMFAQECSCGFEHQHETLMKNPAAKAAYEKSLKLMKSKKFTNKHEGKYIIPVVFHVFGSTFNDKTTLSVEKIQDAIERTNKDYQGKNADWNATSASSRFEKIKAPLDVEFRLAKIDAKGQATTGIEFFPERSGFGNGQGYDEDIQRYAWDNDKYMNVYIMNDLYADGDKYNSGVAWLPNQWMSDNNLARVVYNGSYIGSNTNENFRRVLTHEFGHFLGLHHTFEGGCAYPNDFVEDTPPVAVAKWGKDKVNCEGNYADWENFMNYTDAYLHFTKGQIDRMEGFLNENPRITLWQESNLKATGVNDGYIQGPSVLASGAVFNETMYNRGELEGNLALTAAYGLEFVKTGKLVLGTDYEVTGLPEGLTPVLYVDNNLNASFNITGNAKNHTSANTVDNVVLTLKTSLLKGSDKDIKVAVTLSFIDPYTSLCSFSPRFAPCAFIKNVEFAGFSNETEFNGHQYADFSSVLGAGLEVGKTYTMKVKVQNWSSGAGDGYKVRLWMDWNGDYILDKEELIDTKSILKIGTSGTEHNLEFEVTVPNDVVIGQKFNFRLMLHYTLGKDGVDPCGAIDSGDVEDYGAIIGTGWDSRPPVTNPDEVCTPEISYRPYACITKVDFNGMVNSTTGDTEGTYPIEDFRQDDKKLIKLNKGGTYTLKVDYLNIDSSIDDPYKLRVYVDWNNNNKLENSERQTLVLPKIGAKMVASTAEFSIVVPADAVLTKPLHFRVFLHFGKPTSMDGELPCGTVENGQVEDYYLVVSNSSEGTGIKNIEDHKLVIYPNPTKGRLMIDTDSAITGYRLYSIDGKLVREENTQSKDIDLSGNASGMYILKVLTENGVKQVTVIIK